MGEGSLGDLYVFDTRTSAWSLVDSGGSGATPQARSYHAMTSVGTDLYVFGGCGEGGRLNDLHRYDTAARTWQALPVSSTIAGRGGSCLTATADGKSLLVVAGFCGHELSDLHRFDLAAGSWDCPSCCNSNAGLPSRSVFGTAVHRCGGGCSHADHIVAFGGEIDPSDKGHAGAGDFTDEAFCLHAGHGWHKLEAGGTRKPCPRGWFASAALPDGRMVVHGGLDNANERLGDMFALSLHD